VTMTALLADLERQGIRIGLREDGQLKVRAPKGALTAEVRDRLVAHKPTLLAWLRSRSGSTRPSITPVPRDRPLPLSFAQQRLWVLEQVEGAGATYSVPAAFRMRGALDLEALRGSFAAITARHEVLRTRFAEVGHQPVQIIAPELRPELAIVDLSEEALAQTLEDAVREPFDLASGPLIRAQLYRLGDRDHVFFVNMHHVVTDGWSRGLFIHELVTLYRALHLGHAHDLEPLRVQYADFAVWQRQTIDEQRQAEQVATWRRQLAELADDVGFPTDRQRPPRRGMQGAALGFDLGNEVRQGLERLARATSTSLFIVLMSVFQLWQRFYRGGDDVVTGTDFAGRQGRDVERLIGFFVNQIAIRTRFTGQRTFADLAADVGETVHQAHANADLPFESVVEALGRKRDLSRTPIFQNKFVLQTQQKQTRDLPGLTIEPLLLAKETAKFDVLLNVSVGDRGLYGSLQYSTELFEKSTIARMIAGYETLATALARDPEATLDALLAKIADTDRAKRGEAEQQLASASLKTLGRRRRVRNG